MAILDQFGRPVESLKKPERRPLAAAPVMDSWRDYVSAGLTPQRLSSLLREADTGNVSRQAELFDQMEEKDAHLLGEAEKRRNAILDVDFRVIPASEDSRDVKVAEVVQQYFDDSSDWDDTIVALQDAVGKGFSALEINWDVSTGQAMPTDLIFIEQKRFNFADTAGYLRKFPRLMSDANMMGDEIPAWKMLFHRYGGKSGHAARSGLYRVCAWMYLFRNYAVKDWMAFLEVFGMPLRLGKYDTGASQGDKDALIAAIQSLGSDAAGIISKNTEIEFVESLKNGSKGDNPFLAMAEFCGKEISKALLGQTLSADVGEVGSYAAAQTHNEVRLDLAKADTRSVAATVRYQLIRPMVGFNFGWDTPVPGYKAIWTKQEDLKSLSEVYTNVIRFGQPVSAEHVSERFGIPLPEKDQEILQPKSQTPINYAAKSSKKAVAGRERMGKLNGRVAAKDAIRPEFDPEQMEIEELADDGLDQAAGIISSLDEPIRRLIASVSSLDELRDRIFEVYAGMDKADLAALVKDALGTAALAGVVDAEKTRGQRK